MAVAIGVVLVVVGAAAASTIARAMAARTRRPVLAAAVAPAGVLIGAGAALVRGWDLLPSAGVGAVLVAVLTATTGMRVAPRRGRSPR